MVRGEERRDETRRDEPSEDGPELSGDTDGGSAGRSEAQAGAPARAAKGPKGVFYLPYRDKPFGGSVGDSIRVEELREIIAQADKEGPGQIVVLDIESGGGSVIEAIRICETIQEAKDRHTFVAWPGYAISAAAYASLACDRIVFKSNGRLGAITMHRSGQPVSDEEERRWTTMLEHTLEESGQSPYWAKAMVKNAGFLSYVKDPVTGECEHFNQFQGVPGEVPFDLAPSGEEVPGRVRDQHPCGDEQLQDDQRGGAPGDHPREGGSICRAVEQPGHHRESVAGREIRRAVHRDVERAIGRHVDADLSPCWDNLRDNCRDRDVGDESESHAD